MSCDPEPFAPDAPRPPPLPDRVRPEPEAPVGPLGEFVPGFDGDAGLAPGVCEVGVDDPGVVAGLCANTPGNPIKTMVIATEINRLIITDLTAPLAIVLPFPAKFRRSSDLESRVAFAGAYGSCNVVEFSDNYP